MKIRALIFFGLAGLLPIRMVSVASAAEENLQKVVISEDAVYSGRTEPRTYVNELVFAIRNGNEFTTMGLPLTSNRAKWDISGPYAFVLQDLLLLPGNSQPYTLSRFSLDALRSFNTKWASPTEHAQVAGPVAETLGTTEVAVSPLNNLKSWGNSRQLSVSHAFVAVDHEQVVVFIRAGATLTAWSYSIQPANARDERLLGEPLLPGNPWEQVASMTVPFTGDFQAAKRGNDTFVLLAQNASYELNLQPIARRDDTSGAPPIPSRGEVENMDDVMRVRKRLLEPQAGTPPRELNPIVGRAMLIADKDQGTAGIVDASQELTVVGEPAMRLNSVNVWQSDGRPDLQALHALFRSRR